jgi:cytochrome c oxidase subunit II
MRAALLAVAVLGVAACGCDGSDQPALSAAAEEGRRLANRSGCSSCHGVDGGGGIGPPWAGALGTEAELEDGSTVTVDEEYLTTSIADPDAQVRAGFTVSMPTNQLSDDEIAKIVAYIAELREEA